MVDQVLRPMIRPTFSLSSGPAVGNAASALPGGLAGAASTPARLGAAALSAAGLGAAVLVGTLLASTPARADEVTVETRIASGARGDAILVKPASVGQAIDLKSIDGGPPSRSNDPLQGLTRDPSREAFSDSSVASTSGMRLRERRGPDPASKGLASDDAGTASTTSSSSSSSTSTLNSTESLSPVYVDAAGNVRALPGGVIVTFDAEVGPDAARAAIEAGGHTVERQLAPGIWLVHTASGDAAVETARALAASGGYRSVEPNWWRQPVTK